MNENRPISTYRLWEDRRDMKHETIPFPRQFGPGSASGVDMRAVKRALAAEHGGPEGMSLKTNTFAKPAQVALSAFKGAHGLLNDPIYTSQAHEKLIPWFDEYGASLMNKAAKHIAAVAQRSAFVDQLKWMIANRDPRHYAQTRPIPVVPAHSTINATDCSGSITVAAYWAQVPDPNGFGYNGQGNTGTMLSHGLRIDPTVLIPGDLVIYRRGTWDTYGHHVCAVIDGHGTGSTLFSHGHEGCPCAVSYADEAAGQARFGASTVTPVRFLPTP